MHTAIERFLMLEAGRLTLCSMAEMSKVITDENADALLAEVQGLSKRKTEALVAKQLPPVKAQHEKVRKVHVAPVVLPPVAAAVNSAPLFVQEPAPVSSSATSTHQQPASVMTNYSFLADKEFDDLLAAVKVHTGHKPLTEILKATMRSYLREKAPKSSQVRSFNTEGRYIPKHLRQSVLERDGGRCSFVSQSGVRCCSQVGLQIDHIVPFARGGRTDPSNLRTLCVVAVARAMLERETCPLLPRW